MSKVRLMTAAALLVGSIALIAADRPATKPATANSTLVPACSNNEKKVYSVADVVVPLRSMKFVAVTPEMGYCAAGAACCPNCVICASGTKDPCGAYLIKAITDYVKPKCWVANGGASTIEYFPGGMALIVNAPEDVHADVVDLLDQVRRICDVGVEVGVEVRMVFVSEEFSKRLGLEKLTGQSPRAGVTFEACDNERCCDETDKPRMLPLAAWQTRLFMQACCADENFNVMQCPKLTVTDGQRADVCVQEFWQPVTGVSADIVNGQVVVTPKKETIPIGTALHVRPFVSSDHRSVSIRFQYEHSYVPSSIVPKATVTMQLAPDHADGGKGMPARNSFYIEKPRVDRIQIDTKFALPDGGTMLIDAGKIEEDVRCEYSVPVLSEIPGIGRLFRHERLEHKSSHVYVLVTPKVLCVDDAADKQGGDVAKACRDNDCRKAGQCAQGCCKLAEGAKLAPPAIALPPAATAVEVGPPPIQQAQAPSDAPRVVVISPPVVFGQGAVQQAQALNALAGGVVVAPASHQALSAKSAVEQRAEKKAAKLVQKYHEACANGEGEKARKYARQALDLDPTCFGKTLIQQTYQRMPRPADDVMQVFEAPIPAAPVLPR